MLNKPTRVQENKVVMAKLSRDDFSKLQKYCELKKESVNSIVRKAIMNEIENPISYVISGKNIFEYNSYKDNYSWLVLLDSGLKVDLETDLSAEYVSQLFEEIKKSVEERNSYIKKQNTDSVSIPSKLVRRKL